MSSHLLLVNDQVNIVSKDRKIKRGIKLSSANSRSELDFFVLISFVLALVR